MNVLTRYRRAWNWGYMTRRGALRLALRRDWREIRLFRTLEFAPWQCEMLQKKFGLTDEQLKRLRQNLRERYW